MERPDRVIRFIENLTITSGEHAGEAFVLRDWQKDIIRGIYGPANEIGRRQIRTSLITMPRKNGKTQLAAALCLAHLLGPESEVRGQIYSAAADRQQASLIFNEAKAMIEAAPELSERVNIIESVKRIVHYQSGSFYQALSADAKSKHGFSASFIIYDELAQAPNRQLFDVLTTSTAARAEPLTVVISTQSNDPNHIMSELVDYGRQVQDGIADDPTFHAVIYEAPEESDVWDEEVWSACNPALGDFRSIDEMRTAAKQAQRIPARESAFRSLYLNQRVDADQRFISAADWMACSEVFDPEDLVGRPCWCGLDLSSTTDLSAFILYFPEDQGRVLPFFWLPRGTIEKREHSDKVPYRLWSDQGYCELNNGRAIDKYAIAYRLAELQSKFDIQMIAYDRWRMADLRKLLEDEGIDLPLCDWGQGYKDMGPAVDVFETAVIDRKITHPNNPILNWNVANAVVESDPAGARKISKVKAIDRVDGAVALTMAVGLHAREPEPFDFETGFIRVLTL